MKKIFLLAPILFSISVSVPAWSQDTTGTALSSSKFERKIKKKNAVVLDVRTTEEYNDSFIPKAINYNVLDSLKFVGAVQPLDKNKKYFLYCKSGRRSGKALLMMKNMGFKNVHHLSGGITAWEGKKEMPNK
ncbi:MAG TPA: rhodanese-like domain-containing protein [Chitinophagaceae bacterium]|nr:rhodanese-like domain-containing protein [Chitinophagaceae bacterium]